MAESPQRIDVHFLEMEPPPTVVCHPSSVVHHPPVFAALANALDRATGRRF